MKLAQIFCLALVGILFVGCSKINKPKIKNAFPNSPDQQLALAAFSGDKKRVEKLIKEGADINCKGWIQTTPVGYAIREKNKYATQILLELGADPNIQNEAGYSAVIYAASIDDDPWYLEMVIKYGGDVNQGGKRGTPLINAVHSPENIKLLIKAGADVNKQDWTGVGDTVLMIAAMFNQYDLVYYLLSECHADPTLKVKNGTSFFYIIQHAHVYISPSETETIQAREKVIQWLKDHNQWHEEIPPWKQEQEGIKKP